MILILRIVLLCKINGLQTPKYSTVTELIVEQFRIVYAKLSAHGMFILHMYIQMRQIHIQYSDAYLNELLVSVRLNVCLLKIWFVDNELYNFYE